MVLLTMHACVCLSSTAAITTGLTPGKAQVPSSICHGQALSSCTERGARTWEFLKGKICRCLYKPVRGISGRPSVHAPGQDGQLNGAAPALWVEYPGAVLGVGLAQECLCVLVWVARHCLRNNMPAQGVILYSACHIDLLVDASEALLLQAFGMHNQAYVQQFVYFHVHPLPASCLCQLAGLSCIAMFIPFEPRRDNKTERAACAAPWVRSIAKLGKLVVV